MITLYETRNRTLPFEVGLKGPLVYTNSEIRIPKYMFPITWLDDCPMKSLRFLTARGGLSCDYVAYLPEGFKLYPQDWEILTTVRRHGIRLHLVTESHVTLDPQILRLCNFARGSVGRCCYFVRHYSGKVLIGRSLGITRWNEVVG